MFDYYRQGRREVRSWRDIVRSISAIVMISFGVYLVVCLATLLYGMDLVFPELETRSFTLHVVFFEVLPFVTMSGALLYGWYLFLVSAIILSAIWVFLSSARGFVGELTMKSAARDHSPFFDMCGLMFAVFFINTAIVLAMMAIGSEVADPIEEMETWELLFLLANASVWEELVIRVLMIGLPLIAVDAAMRRGLRKPHKYVLGGGISIGRVEVALILVSSVIFGFGHLEGWGVWKVFPSGLAGVAFGYLYLRHGLAASILLHFSFDYLSMPLLVFDGSLALTLTVGIGILLWIGLGLLFAIYFTIRIVEFLRGRTLFDPERRGAMAPVPAGTLYRQPQPARQPDGWVGADRPSTHESPRFSDGGGAMPPPSGSYFICPVCGSTGARWMDGKLQCLSCGRLFE